MRNGIALAALMVASVWGADAWAGSLAYCSPMNPNNGNPDDEELFGAGNNPSAPAEVYEITIKKVLFCTTEDCSGSSNVALFEGTKTLDIASLSSGAFEQLVPPTTTIPAGTYKAIGFVLANSFKIKGSVSVGGGNYCATPDGSIVPTDNPTTICVVGVAPGSNPSAGTVTVKLPEPPGGISGGFEGKYSYAIGKSPAASGEFAVAFILDQQVVVPSPVQVGEVEDTMGLFFNVDSGVEAQTYDVSGVTTCRVGLGTVKVTFKIGDQALVNNAEVSAFTPPQ